MNIPTSLRASALAAVLGFTPIAPAAAEDSHFITFAILNDGVQIAERRAHEAALKPIANRRGFESFHGYDLLVHLNGLVEDAVRLRIWQVSDPSALQSLNADKDYKDLIPRRDEIHDMARMPICTAKGAMDTGQIESGFALVDLVVMADGAGPAERDAYRAKIEPIAARYGFKMVAAFEINGRVSGDGPDQPLRLNIWSIPSMDAMGELGKDEDYAALEDERLALHDFETLTLFFAQPKP